MPPAWRTPPRAGLGDVHAGAARAALPGVRVEPLPRVLAQAHGGELHRFEAGEVARQRGGEVRQGLQRVLGGEGVDDVAHRVGGRQAGVVAVDVDRLEVPAQGDVGGQVAQQVALRAARDLDDADLGLAVRVGAEAGGHRSAPAVGRVAERAQQQRHVQVLPGALDGELERDLREERVVAEVAGRVEAQPEAAGLGRFAEVADAAVRVGRGRARARASRRRSPARGRRRRRPPAARRRGRGRGS